jgi:hypothetical protein
MPPIDPEAVAPAGGPPAPRHVTIRTSCWVCGEVLEKQVPPRRHGHRYFNWRCDECEVAWAGPGEVA